MNQPTIVLFSLETWDIVQANSAGSRDKSRYTFQPIAQKKGLQRSYDFIFEACIVGFNQKPCSGLSYADSGLSQRTETLKKVTATKYLYVSFVSVLKTKKTQVKVNIFSLSAKPDNEVDFNILQYILLICTRLLYEHNAISMGTPFHRFSLCWRIF